jgi:DNA primase
MINQLLLSLTNSVLGTGKSTARNNFAYHCPFCNHHKPKLEINFTENKEGLNPWACWVCNNKGKKLITLFKKVNASSDKILELKSYVKIGEDSSYLTPQEILELPKEYKPLTSGNGIIFKHALSYLKSRKITENDIIKYNIGYCEYGPYKNMIIIPSYDHIGNINYFTARSFEKEPFIKYKNPSVSRNIIPFELLINWNIPIILCEGMFDAIAIKRNAIPLLGKNIQTELMKKLINSSVKKIYIALDKDAIKASLKHCETLMDEGKEIYLVDLEDKDPSEMGTKRFINLIQNTIPLTYEKLMDKKLQLI